MRTGLVAKKIGMSRLFQSNGKNIPVTLLKLDNLKVIDKKTSAKHGYNALKISYGASKKINKPQKGFFKKLKVDSSSNTVEFRISEEGFIDIGTQLSANHLVCGQYVDVTGYTIGKGFAGGMKRHNFAGNRATHGVSISHRSHGSTGQCQDPGKVFKGKKMAGRLGNVKRTMQNLEVMETDVNEGIIVLKGSVPGPKGLTVFIYDSIKIKNNELPYPTNSDNNSNNLAASDDSVKSSIDLSNEENDSAKIKNISENSEKKDFQGVNKTEIKSQNNEIKSDDKIASNESNQSKDTNETKD